MLRDKKILLGITGSIAAYKTAALIRLLIKAGAEVKIVMTPAAREFVSALTLSTLSKNPVLSDLSENNSWSNHVMLGRWANVMLVAPLSCNTLAKMAHGICDNLFTAVYLSATCPVIVAPAMDEDMWHHPATKNNLQIIERFGNKLIPVENGDLASGLTGEGRMAEPETILKRLEDFFSDQDQLSQKKVLVTAGPTYEALDPVRFIGNHSSGKMGIAIAKEFKKKGALVTLILGPSSEEVPAGLHVIRVKTAEEMFNACMSIFDITDIAVMSAAVADYTPVNVATNKIKKSEEIFSVEFKKTKDILKQLGTIKKEGQLLAGFALETTDERNNALKKLSEKNADLIILNSLNDSGAGFGGDTNKITIFDKNGGEQHFDTKSKKEVAVDIVNTIIQLYHVQ
jgi:phosphopantothenoylcysteine decarboxylase/phosphopantothenate--cysteine ligase